MTRQALFRTISVCLMMVFPVLATAQDTTGESASADAVENDATKQSALDIMIMVNSVNMGDRVSQRITMTLIDKNGRERTQVAKSYRRRIGDGQMKITKSIMFFTAPDNMKDTGFLSWDFDDPTREDKQWIYLPRTGKTKRIAGNDKRLAFMGTDFSHADMALRNIQSYNYTLLREEEIDGHKVWVIEALPVNPEVITEDGYTRSEVYVRQDNYMVVRSINSLKKGNRTKQMDVVELKLIDDIWVQTEVVMATWKGETLLSKTIMQTDKVKFDQRLKEEFFTVRQMEKGP